MDNPLLGAVSYLQAVNLTFAGTLKDRQIHHAGQPVFACLGTTSNCSTCEQNFYLSEGKCLSLVQQRMNCGTCSRGFVRGLRVEAGGEVIIDESTGCYRSVDSRRGDGCYFGLAADSSEAEPKFTFRCSQCFDASYDP